jgi:DNA end-binding protein Ku
MRSYDEVEMSGVSLTLRYPYEIRDERQYFDDIPDRKIPKDMLELARHIVES